VVVCQQHFDRFVSVGVVLRFTPIPRPFRWHIAEGIV
jgi:hypothetical protein